MTRPGDDYLWDRSGPADPDVARLEELLAPLAHDAPLDEIRLRRRGRLLPTIAILAGVAAAVAVVLLVLWRSGGREPESYACGHDATGFRFTAAGGSVACGGATVAAGVLPVGGVLDTGAHRAELAIANIGRAELGSQTRVRLDRTGAERHQLFLERGWMHARVSAPPRIFAVGTPGAAVTDLGCEYTLEVDASGRGTISVASGKVELESGTGRIVVVPRGTRARLLEGRRAGLPHREHISPAIAAAIAAYEDGAPDGMERVLAVATRADAITLANLAELVPAERRRAVLERLAAVRPPPLQMSLDDVLSDRGLFQIWFDDVVIDPI